MRNMGCQLKHTVQAKHTCIPYILIFRAVTINPFIGILRYKSKKVQYIGTKNLSRYITGFLLD